MKYKIGDIVKIKTLNEKLRDGEKINCKFYETHGGIKVKINEINHNIKSYIALSHINNCFITFDEPSIKSKTNILKLKDNLFKI